MRGTPAKVAGSEPVGDDFEEWLGGAGILPVRRAVFQAAEQFHNGLEARLPHSLEGCATLAPASLD